ncbi:MAG: uroporphyrinogen-III C-methyltransferase [bacterium]|nr:uroporphyrinogen-III C-methyltransferase [bacterium]
MSSDSDETLCPGAEEEKTGKHGIGKVDLVGAGPGDLSLITVKALDCIQRADLVVYDHLVNPYLLRFLKPGAEEVYVGKVAGKHALPQDKINALLSKAAAEGKMVCRLKGGDPFIFGRGGEEAEYLVKKGIPFEVVPGVTSAIAAPAYAGIPLTHRKMASTVAFITGNEATDKPSSSIAWEKLSTGADTLVFLMGVANLPEIAARLVKEGRDPNTPAAVIEWGTMPWQRCVEGRLEEIAAVANREKVQSPAITIVGEVVTMRKHLAWYEKKPFFGKRIVVTRATTQASSTTEMIEKLGGDPIEFPTIRIEPLEDYKELDAAIESLSKYDWIVFTSVNGVEAVLDRAFELGKDVRCLGGVRICSIGPNTTEALRKRQLVPDLQPARFSSEGIIEACLRSADLRGKKVLLTRSMLADDMLPSTLAELGAEVTDVPCYRTIKAEPDRSVIEMLVDGDVDAVIFTSASTVRNFAEILGDDLQRIWPRTVFACIGPVTAAAARDVGLDVQVESVDYTIPALLVALIAHFHGKLPPAIYL